MELKDIKEIAEAATYLVASVGGPMAAIWTFIQWRDSVNQRKIEHRWHQAEVGRQLVSQLFDDDRDAGAALEIIDGERDHVEIPSEIAITAKDINKALGIPFDTSDTSRKIRRHFDALFYHLERFQHLIDIGLITKEDILNPTQYYCEQLKRFNAVIPRYMQKTFYTKALALITSLQNDELPNVLSTDGTDAGQEESKNLVQS